MTNSQNLNKGTKHKVELQRVQMNLPTDLVKKVVEFGESKGLNTTSAYIVLLNQALEQNTTVDYLPLFLNAISKLQDYKNIEDSNSDDKQ